MAKKWLSVGDNHLNGIVLFNFCEDKPHRIQLIIGDVVAVVKECGDWYYGYSKNNFGLKGIFPKSYVELISKNNAENNFLKTQEEIYDVLKEWQYFCKLFYKTTDSHFNELRDKIFCLIKLRLQLQNGFLPITKLKEIKLAAVKEIDTGYKLGLGLAVRNDSGQLLDVQNASTITMFHQHLVAVRRVKFASIMEIVDANKESTFNLHLTVNSFTYNSSEDVELIFALFDEYEMKAISENFVITNAGPLIAKKTYDENNTAIFTNLNWGDLDSEKTYLVAYVVQVGVMNCKSGLFKKAALSKARILHAVAAVYLPALWDSSIGDVVHKEIAVFHKEMVFLSVDCENLETGLRRYVSLGGMNRKSINNSSVVSVDIQLMNKKIKQVEDFFQNTPNIQKLIFPYVPLPDDDRHDLYVTLVTGEFDKGKKVTEKNVEVQATICNDDYEAMHELNGGYLEFAVNGYESLIYYHQAEPKWNEVFKINIPAEDYDKYHIRFTFTHRTTNKVKARTEKPFGLSYLRLTENGTVQQDGDHVLLVYHYTQKKYLNYPVDRNQRSSMLERYCHSAREKLLTKTTIDSFTVNTHLCSTRLTKNIDLLHILSLTNYMSNSSNEALQFIENALIAFTKIPPEEVVKFWRHILEILFLVLAENLCAQKLDGLVFHCILQFLDIFSETRYHHFLPFLDEYISTSFSAALVHGKITNVLLKRIRRAMGHHTPASRTSTSQKTPDDLLIMPMKHLQYLIKFIIRSRILYENQVENSSRIDFENKLDDLLGSIAILFTDTITDVKFSRQALLTKFHIVTTELLKIYDSVKLSEIIVKILKSRSISCLNDLKLECIENLIDSPIFRLTECRDVLLGVVCDHIKYELEKNEKVPECVRVLEKLLVLVFEPVIEPVENHVAQIILILLRPVMETLIKIDSESSLVGNLDAIFLEIIHNMHAVHYKIYVANCAKPHDLHDSHDLHIFISEVIQLFRSLTNNAKFPNDWTHMILHQCKVISKSLKHLSNVLKENLFDQSDKQIWKNWFQCAFELVNRPGLQLDQYSPNKQCEILSQYRTIQRKIAIDVSEMWSSLDGPKTEFVLEFVDPVLEMSMIPDLQVREASLTVFSEIIQSILSSDSCGCTLPDTYKLNDIETATLKKFDALIESGKGDADYRVVFNEAMLKTYPENEALKNIVAKFDKLLENLLDYHTWVQSTSKDNTMRCLVELLQFSLEIKQYEIHLKYIYKLYDMHIELKNYCEAAFALKMHADLLKWDNVFVAPMIRSERHKECSTNRELKKQLYTEIIELLDKGKMWEYALELCEEQIQFFENAYVCPNMLITQEIINRKLVTESRHKLHYYRVVFVGKAFPNFLQGKPYIYRGNELERLVEFRDRITSQHPKATFEVGKDDAEENFIQINSVELCEKSMNSKSKFVEKFILMNCDKSRCNSYDEINKWFQRETITTKNPLPGIVRWSLIAVTETVDVSPIENAIESMESTNAELQQLISSDDFGSNLKQISMRVSGVLDAPVNGGFLKYQEAFLTKDYLEQNPGNDHLVRNLTVAKTEQDSLLKQAIDIHGLFAPIDLEPLQKHFEKLFCTRCNCTEYINENIMSADMPKVRPDCQNSNNTIDRLLGNNRKSTESISRGSVSVIGRLIQTGAGSWKKKDNSSDSLRMDSRSSNSSTLSFDASQVLSTDESIYLTTQKSTGDNK